MDDNLNAVEQDFLQKWEERLSALEAELVEQTAIIVQKFEEKSARLAQREAELDFDRASLDEMQRYVEQCQELLENFEADEKALAARKAQLENQLAARKEQLEKQFAEQFEQLDNRFAEQSEQLEKQIAARKSQLEEEFSVRQFQLEEQFAERKTRLEAQFAERNSQLEAQFAEQFEQLEKQSLEQSELNAQKSAQLSQQESELLLRETTIKEKEIALEANLNVTRNEFQKKLLDYRQSELDKLSTTLFDERKQHMEQLQLDLARERETRTKELDNREAELDSREERIDQKEFEQSRLDGELRRTQRRLSNREESLNELERNLEAEVEDRCKSRTEEFNAQLGAKDVAYDQLLAHFNRVQREAEQLKAIRDSFGGEPFEAMNKTIVDLQTENRKLREQIQALPSADVGEELEAKIGECENLTLERDHLRRLNAELGSKAAEAENLDMQLKRSKIKIDELSTTLDELRSFNENLHEQLKRLRADEGRLVEREERIRSIKAKLPNVHAPIIVEDEVPIVNEIDWLENIGRNCREYGFKFPARILYAFHTALKIADWSTLTVLDGVSGTGKSELPHLYSKFGGLNFISVPVQPNWDSQESMLGFFNSIDNKFDAQPLLRFLAQCSSDEDNMNRSLNVVLLDEMNLAHVEHYFAEFLSKLELRRDTGSQNEPTVEINIGAGMEPYHLKLTRNILWTGTMNRDETTKSLSDKVLDRGLVINFPRPKEFISRNKLQPIDDFVKMRGIRMLDYRVWSGQWIKTEPTLSEEQQKLLTHYREVIQRINDYLAVVGRALGHRVWQSIEFYTINYPKVAESLAMLDGEVDDNLKKYVKLAVEDQIVQKVMPRLRGIETRGAGYDDCLQKIRALLLNEEFGLDDDFALAERAGYGQFLWCSAEYIKDDDSEQELPDD